MLAHIVRRYIPTLVSFRLDSCPDGTGGWTPETRVVVLTWARAVTRANGYVPSERLR